MLLNKIDRYYATNSLLHRMNSIVKIICYIIFMIIIVTDDLLVNLILVDLLSLLIILSRVPLSIYLEPIIRLRYFWLGIIVICLLLGLPFVVSIVVVIKIILIIWYLLLITLTTSQSEITYSLEKILSPLKLIKIPVKKLSLGISFGLRFIPVIFNQASSVVRKLKSRGLGESKFMYFQAFIPTLILTYLEFKKVKMSMDLRMFDIGKRRTNYRFNCVGIFDIIIIVVHLGLLFLMIRCEV